MDDVQTDRQTNRQTDSDDETNTHNYATNKTSFSMIINM